MWDEHAYTHAWGNLVRDCAGSECGHEGTSMLATPRCGVGSGQAGRPAGGLMRACGRLSSTAAHSRRRGAAR